MERKRVLERDRGRQRQRQTETEKLLERVRVKRFTKWWRKLNV